MVLQGQKTSRPSEVTILCARAATRSPTRRFLFHERMGKMRLGPLALVVAAACGTTISDATPLRAPASRPIIKGTVRFQLPNGLKVVLQESHAAPVVAFQAWIGVGSADEQLEEAGIAHVFEHMLFKGTERRGVGQIAHEIEAAGGDINAWTSFDQTVYH